MALRLGLSSLVRASTIAAAPQRALSTFTPLRASVPAGDKDSILLDVDAKGFAHVTLNRGDTFNTLSAGVISRYTEVWEEVGKSKSIRGVFIRAKGKLFCAGANLQWMKETATYSREQNLADAEALGRMLFLFNTLPVPTVALVQGPAFGGGVGLVSCCDIAVGTVKSSFTLSEVKLGIMPATISPYVAARIGANQARRYFLTAEKIEAQRAKEIGLLHEVVDNDEGLNTWEATLKERIMEASPASLAATKDLIRLVAGRDITPALISETAVRLADIRASAEGQEGLSAFFERRKPSWVK